MCLRLPHRHSTPLVVWSMARIGGAGGCNCTRPLRSLDCALNRSAADFARRLAQGPGGAVASTDEGDERDTLGVAARRGGGEGARPEGEVGDRRHVERRLLAEVAALGVAERGELPRGAQQAAIAPAIG